MPQLDVKTASAKSVWKSPDGQREIFELGLDYNGTVVKAKTYSKEIAQPGWSGTVETYEKEGRNGSETFVKQPAKEGGYSGPRGGGGGGKPSSDPFTMYLSYAKDIAVAMLKDGKLDEAAYGVVLDAVLAGGKTLFEGHEAKPATPDLTELNKVMGEVIPESPEDQPWLNQDR